MHGTLLCTIVGLGGGLRNVTSKFPDIRPARHSLRRIAGSLEPSGHKYYFEVNKGIVHRVRSKELSDIGHDTGSPPLLQLGEEVCLVADIIDYF
jgi:hypothetical protein